ncbi:MAG: anti-sigma factor [Pedobacter sp.]
MEEGKAYIESGMLELYVLGQLTAQEQTEVQAMASNYPEVKQEIGDIEIALERYAVENGIKPTVGLEKRIFDQIGITETVPQHETKVIPLNAENQAKYQSKIRSLQLALVACVAFLVVSIAALYAVHSDLGTAKERIASLSADREKFSSTVNYMKQNNADLNKVIAIADDPSWKTIKLAGKKDPNDNMVVYWNPKRKHVMVNTTKMVLPINDKAHQYQLWALVNGKPVDLGVFDVDPNAAQVLVDMKEIAVAQAFAVTLELRGGSPTPTMEQMMAMGGV